MKTGSGAHPASYPVGTGALPPGVKRLGREADHSPPPIAEVKNGGAILLLPDTSSWHGDLEINELSKGTNLTFFTILLLMMGFEQ
jgi:hypothetical protein